jgi:hypothetical protein
MTATIEAPVPRTGRVDRRDGLRAGMRSDVPILEIIGARVENSHPPEGV